MNRKRTYKAMSVLIAAAASGLAFAAVGGAIVCHAAPIVPNASRHVDTPLGQKVGRLQTGLSKKGYDVAKGDFHLFTIEDCKYAIQSIGNCLGNNPTAPYIIPTVPLWPDEFVDGHMKDMLGPVADNKGWTYRLGEQDAIVIMAKLPPPGRYFGMQSYIFSRDVSANLTDSIYQTLSDAFMKSILFMSSPNPSRQLLFSSIGDSINNVVIENQSGAAFDQQRFFVITANATLGQELSDELLRTGVPDRSQIFIERVSPGLARLGLNSASDDFMMLIRYALPKDATAGDQWRQQLPMTVLRVRNKNPSPQYQVYVPPVRETRVARSELALQSSLDDVVAAVKIKWGQSAALDSNFFSLLEKVDLVGEHCLRRPMNCLGDTGDADYQISQTVELDSGEVLAAVGTLGTATGNAVYTSLSVNQIPQLVGVANLTDVDLAGSASAFSASVANTEKIYLQYFARDCANLPNCLEVNERMVPQGDKLKIIQRNYIVPGSSRGPDPKMLVNPRLIILKRQ
jgi:hypothetical protein